jgi:hypothetical protein
MSRSNRIIHMLILFNLMKLTSKHINQKEMKEKFE